MYLPYGPVVREYSNSFLFSLKKHLARLARIENSIFVRVDFTPPVPNEMLSKFFTPAPLYTYHSAYFQPRAEWFLSLGKTENELFAALHSKTRYSVRLAEKRGITAEIITRDLKQYFPVFYELLAETAKRNDFSLSISG